MSRKYMGFLVLLFCFCLCGCGAGNEVHLEAMQTDGELLSRAEETTEEDTEDFSEQYYVYVCGAVRNPGVYELPENSRVFEAIELAGGMTEDACVDAFNQADKVVDGQMIRVPTVQEAQEETVQQMQEADGLLDLNRATVEELMTLPGIGQAKAEALVRYRETRGRFSSVEEVMNVEGIKEGVFYKIKDSIKV